MAMRMFTVTQDQTVSRTVTYEVEAETFEAAEEAIYEGYGMEVDYDDYDWDSGSIDTIECQDCGADCSEDCECEREAENESLKEFLAEIGL